MVVIGGIKRPSLYITKVFFSIVVVVVVVVVEV